MEGGKNTFYITVYLWCVIPIVLSLLILVVGLFRVYCSGRDKAKRKAVKYSHIWMFLFLSYLVLPAVSNKQLSVFSCVELTDGESYLRIDTSIDCKSPSYLQFRSIIICFILIYQLIPIIWMTLLFRRRKELNPPTSDESLVLYIRENNPKVSSLKFLFRDYKAKKWWFEVVEMYRRIVFVGVTPLVSPQPTIRTSFGLVLAVISIIYYRDTQPYRVPSTNRIADFAQVCVYV
jgi:hypothetical protein